MQPAEDPDSPAYYGNRIVRDVDATVASDEWSCIEIHAALNTGIESAHGAELSFWLEDSLVHRLMEDSPLGYRTKDEFCPSNTADPKCINHCDPSLPFEPLDLRFRSDSALEPNYI